MLSQQIFECNQQYEPISIVRTHKFTRVDLHLDVLDPSIIFIMKLTDSSHYRIDTSQKLNIIEVDLETTISSHITIYDYDKPLIYYSVDSYLNLTVTIFGYNGPQQNVMAEKVHQLRKPIKTPFSSKQRHAYLPTGRY